MLKNIIRGERKTKVYYRLEFKVDDNGGFSFPCDKDGLVIPGSKAVEESLVYCLAHPEEFKVYNHVVRYVTHWREPDKGTCVCGNIVELRDDYYGAFECQKCGRWYNVFGDELLPPDQWDEDLTGDDYEGW